MRNARYRLVCAVGLVLLGCMSVSGLSMAADPTGSGPERALLRSEDTLPTHTVYRPANLKGRYPVVLWGNGSCVNSNFGYREFLAEIASLIELERIRHIDFTQLPRDIPGCQQSKLRTDADVVPR